MANGKAIDTRYTQDRELSWLRFNERVMDEAWDEGVPLFERLKFAAIFTSNLDEFFMIRVGSLFDMSQPASPAPAVPGRVPVLWFHPPAAAGACSQIPTAMSAHSVQCIHGIP